MHKLNHSLTTTLLSYFIGKYCRNINPAQTTTRGVSEYAAYLKMLYLRSKLPVKGKWPPSPCKKIINLAAIEQNEHSQSTKFKKFDSVEDYMQQNSTIPVSMDNLLQTKDGSAPKIVFVQGAPGIGKSTFAWKFCRRWAKGKIYQQYNLVVLLRMRDTRVREATKLCDVFFYEDKNLSLQLTKEVIASKGKGVLFLMEGLDELPVSCLAEDSLLSNLFEGLSLPEVTMLVTGRPWAGQMLIEKCGDQISRRVEILGFTKEDIPKYVSSAFTTKEKIDCFEFLHLHPQLESIMYIPLNAAFVVQIYKQFKYSQQTIPHTLTQLYTALVKGLLLRYTKSVPEFRDVKILDLDDLPEPIKTQFDQLCLLAFMSFTKLNIQVTFTDTEAALYGCLDSLGLMQSSADLSIDTGTTVTHSFLHFTIQEFLAAYHLSKQPAQVQALFLKTHIKEEFHVLLKFSIGLNSSILNAYNRLIKVSSGVTTALLHWLYESQSPEDVCRILGNSSVHYWCSYRATALDLHALSYCLCHSNCNWSLCLNLESLTYIYHTEHSFSGKIKDLDIVQATLQGLKMFFSLPKRLLTGLHTLSIVTKTDTANIDPFMAQVLTSGVLSNLREFRYCSRFSTISLVMGSLSTCPNLSYIGF